MSPTFSIYLKNDTIELHDCSISINYEDKSFCINLPLFNKQLYFPELEIIVGERYKTEYLKKIEIFINNYYLMKKPDFKGLCVNCYNRYNCQESETGCGVWHCLNYR